MSMNIYVCTLSTWNWVWRLLDIIADVCKVNVRIMNTTKNMLHWVMLFFLTVQLMRENKHTECKAEGTVANMGNVTWKGTSECEQECRLQRTGSPCTMLRGIEKVLQGWEQVEGHSHEREWFWCWWCWVTWLNIRLSRFKHFFPKSIALIDFKHTEICLLNAGIKGMHYQLS